MTAKILYIDMDDVLADFRAGIYTCRDEYPYTFIPQSRVGFFENLKPICGVIDAVNELRKNIIFDVHILTAPSTRNPHSYSEKKIWVEKHFDYKFTKKLIICANKSLLKGQEGLEGELVHFGSNMYPNCASVLDYLNKGILRDG